MFRKVASSNVRLLAAAVEAGSASRAVVCGLARRHSLVHLTASRFYVSPSTSALAELPSTPSWLMGATPPILTPDSMPELLVTCIGNHQAGVVRDVTKTVASFGGTITSSKSMEMGLQFVFVASVFVGDREKANILRLTLNDMRVNCTWIPDTMHEAGIQYTKHKMKLKAQERPGLIFTLSELLAAKGVQINDMDMKTFEDKTTKRMMLSWEAELELPVEAPLDEIKGILEKAAKKEKFMEVEVGDKYA